MAMALLLSCLRDLRRRVYYYLRFVWLTVIPMHIRQMLSGGKMRRMSLIVSRKQKKNVKKHEDIPMSKGWPLIGTIFDFIAAGSAPNLHKYIDKRHQQFGHIFRERIGTQEAVFVSSANLMRSVFMYEGQHPIHPLPESWVLYNKLHSCRRGLFFMDGKEWHTNRKIMNRILLTGNLDWINTHINFCTDKLIEYWKTEEEKVDNYLKIDNLEGQLYRWSIEVVCAVMFGYDIENGSIKIALDEFSKSVHKIFKDSAHLMNFPPKLARFLHMKVWTQFEKNVTHVLQMGNDIFEMSIKQSEASESDGLFSKMQFAGMSMDVIKRIFIDLIIAAGDTTAFSSQWALYLLSQNDEIQEEIRADYLKSEMKDQTVRGLLKETFRLFPVAPFIGRSLASDAIIGDYEIKKNTLVLLSLYTSGRDPDHFPDPLRMKPERWRRNITTGELNDVLQAHGSLPFAIGNRSCIGRKIALSQMRSLVLAVTNNFKIKCLNEVPVDIVLRLVSVPSHPLQLGIKSLGS